MESKPVHKCLLCKGSSRPGDLDSCGQLCPRNPCQQMVFIILIGLTWRWASLAALSTTRFVSSGGVGGEKGSRHYGKNSLGSSGSYSHSLTAFMKTGLICKSEMETRAPASHSPRRSQFVCRFRHVLTRALQLHHVHTHSCSDRCWAGCNGFQTHFRAGCSKLTLQVSIILRLKTMRGGRVSQAPFVIQTRGSE